MRTPIADAYREWAAAASAEEKEAVCKAVNGLAGILRRGACSGKAYVLAGGYLPPTLPEGRKWFVMKVALGMVAEDRCEEELPLAAREGHVFPFTLVATDRDAAKAEISLRVDEMFDWWEEKKRSEKPKEG